MDKDLKTILVMLAIVLVGVFGYKYFKNDLKVTTFGETNTITVKSDAVHTTKIPVKISKVNKTGDIQIDVPDEGTFILKKDMKKGDIIKVDLQQQFDIIREIQRKFKVGAYYYHDKPRIGLAYQVCTFQDVLDKFQLGYTAWSRDVGINVGFTQQSLVLTLHKALSHDVDIFVGTTGEITFGVQVRL